MENENENGSEQANRRADVKKENEKRKCETEKRKTQMENEKTKHTQQCNNGK